MNPDRPPLASIEVCLSEDSEKRIAEEVARRLEQTFTAGKSREEKEFLTQEDVYRYLGFEVPRSPTTLRNHVKNGTLPEPDKTVILNKNTKIKYWHIGTVQRFLMRLVSACETEKTR